MSKRKRSGNGPGTYKGRYERRGYVKPSSPRGPPPIMLTKGYERIGGYYGRFPPVTDSFEMKFHDVDLDDAVIAAAGAVTDSINKIAQGVTEVQRVGRKCTLKSINWRFDCTLPESDAAGTPAPPDVVRVIMYLDKQANGATAAQSDILESADYQSFNNLANKSRFRTLMDRTYALNYAGLGSDGAAVISNNEVVHQDSFFKKVNIPLEFDSTTGAITEIKSNNIGVLLHSKTGVAGFVSKIRLRFSDR